MIHVDFTIKQCDIFWVNLESVKYRLAIGIAIFFLVTGTLIWFFTLIGEQGILLELSPLFIGFPAIAVAGQVLRLHAICRRFMKSLPESQREVQYLFQENAEGYDVIRGGSFSHIVWQDLLMVVEKREYFLILINDFDRRILPKRGFHKQSDIPRLREVMRSKLGPRARLLTA